MATDARPAGHVSPHPSASTYEKAPVVVFWEVTRSCALACRHCRAQAQPKRDPFELTTEEGVKLVDEIAGFSPAPILILSGGDPLMRRDVFTFAARAVERGLRPSLSPSVTALVTPKNLAKAHAAGVQHVSFSLDGATPEVHDAFRGVRGAFARTLECVRDARAAGLTVQINTTVARHNATQLEALAGLVAESGAIMWDVFFLVPTGRAQADEMLSPEEHERVYRWLAGLSRTASFRVKTTLGQAFRRALLQTARENGLPAPQIGPSNDGNGVCFISHVGDIHPSGFLPIPCGNVRKDSLVEVYQRHPVFLDLRDPSRLTGKCGACPYNTVCGGSRARAYACTGDYLAADPTCSFRAS